MTLKLKVNQLKRERAFPMLGGLAQLYPHIDTYYVLAGGSLLSMLDQKTPISDYDIFVLSNNREQLENRKQYIEEKLLSQGFKQTFKCPKGELSTFTFANLKVQIINVGWKNYNTVEEILDGFDFHICQVALHGPTLYITKSCISNFRKKELTVNKITYPSSSINRLAKYRKKGYNVYNTAIDIVAHIRHNIENNIPMNEEIIYVD